MKARRRTLATVIQFLLVIGVAAIANAPRVFTGEAPERPPPRSQLDVHASISLAEARIIIDAAVEQVRSEKGHATIAVVDDNGNVVSMDRMDGTSKFFEKFAVGKAVGAAALQISTAEASDQYKTNPQRFLSALSILQGDVLFIPGGFPLVVEGRLVGAVGSAGHGGDGDVRAAKAGVAAWEKFRQGRKG